MAGGAVVLAGAAGGALAGCSSSSSGSSTTAAASGTPGRRRGDTGAGRLPYRRPGGRDRRVLSAEQSLGHQRLHLRPVPLRPADGHRRRRHHPALPGQVLHAERSIRHVDADAASGRQVQRRHRPRLDGRGQQLQRPEGLAPDRPGPHPGEFGDGTGLDDRRLQTAGARTPGSRPASPPRSATSSARP